VVGGLRGWIAAGGEALGFVRLMTSRAVLDAHIAALAIETQAVVHSNDSDFSRFPGLLWINPLAGGT